MLTTISQTNHPGKPCILFATVLVLPALLPASLAGAAEEGLQAESYGSAPMSFLNAVDREELSPLHWRASGLFANCQPAEELVARRTWNGKRFLPQDHAAAAVMFRGPVPFQHAFGHRSEIRTDIRPHNTGRMPAYAEPVEKNRYQVYWGEVAEQGYAVTQPAGILVFGQQAEVRLEAAGGHVLRTTARAPPEAVILGDGFDARGRRVTHLFPARSGRNRCIPLPVRRQPRAVGCSLRAESRSWSAVRWRGHTIHA